GAGGLWPGGGARGGEPRHERGRKAGGGAGGGRRNCHNYVLGRALALRLQHRLGHLLHEKGNTVGALDYVLLNAWWEELVANDAADHGLDVAPTQPIDGEGRYVGATDPRWIELRTERHDQKQAHAPNLVHSPTKRFQACRVDPLHILKDHQHRTCSR